MRREVYIDPVKETELPKSGKKLCIEDDVIRVSEYINGHMFLGTVKIKCTMNSEEDVID